jgi:uncharacterized protein (DUF2126 family)
MTIQVALHHSSIYNYDRAINLGPHIVRLRPAPHCKTPILSYSLRVEPQSHFLNWQQDPFSNYLARLVFPEKTKRFKVTVDLVAEMAVYNPFDFFLEPEAETYPFKYDKRLGHDLAPYLATSKPGPLLKSLIAVVPEKRVRTIDYLVHINQLIHSQVAYTIRLEPGVQSPEETLQLGSGSCRDSAWLMVHLLRHKGLAARFVSGYLIQLKPDVKALDGPSGAESDFTDLHAWCEVFLPGAGWIGLDPTSGLLAGEGHIPVACTPEPSGASPIFGALDECEVDFSHQMSVTRVFESPRITKPYTAEQWEDIVHLGQSVDEQMAQMDVRLTMGGEPTFVSVTDRGGAEWNTDALGPTKRGYSTKLIQRLKDQYGEGGFLHFGQGKWYPGEQLPRWALSLYWRTDGEPCWGDKGLFANERDEHRYQTADAKRFIDVLSDKLGLGQQFITPGYEDAWYYMWRERKLPVNVNVLDSKVDDEMERSRIRRIFNQGVKEVVGYVLPLKKSDHLGGHSHWQSGPWFFRDEKMFLIPGDSAMGYRLPLDSLPWVNGADYPYQIDLDPYDQSHPLRTFQSLQKSPKQSPHWVMQSPYFKAALGPDEVPSSSLSAGGSVPPGQHPDHTRLPQAQESAHWLIRTALCVEVRNPGRASGPQAEMLSQDKGVVYVFMPPLVKLDDYLELVAKVEATAQELNMPIVLEGYPPPRDARLKMLQVTPDPGVIEVNIHPAHSWDELTKNTQFLYQVAHETGLSTEKFMMDGRHTGTGGGNHFVMGGATPADSPFLRRSDLLPSLLTFWHNHPSLSYLFSGLFIGPTSQAPRVDEARNDQVYELEIAMAEIERQTQLWGQCPPWVIDRALRNLLVDVTGNTHRSEFCIDKLYSPDGPTGRLGLLELRAFEMPPHSQMSLAQQLLIRAMVAWFWRAPYKGHGAQRLHRWGTELHDRYLLPTFVKMDFEDVLAELNAAGFAFKSEWFDPHFEFRFPMIGAVQTRGIELTLRTALEPWHVMGEEGSAGGTVRYVDSSLERLELKVMGYNDNRYSVTVNGRVAPMQPTGVVGEYVLGVRYKAWAPPSALHPSIGMHAPLTIDLVDNALSRSLGGCRYHVTHPGGRNYDSLPINSYEAESRRLTRFTKLGHTPGKINIQRAYPSQELPFTLDLRRNQG